MIVYSHVDVNICLPLDEINHHWYVLSLIVFLLIGFAPFNCDIQQQKRGLLWTQVFFHGTVVLIIIMLGTWANCLFYHIKLLDIIKCLSIIMQLILHYIYLF